MANPLSIGFNVPFYQAIKAAADRGVQLPEIYYSGQQQGIARQTAFSIAGIASLDQLQMVRDSLAKRTIEGSTFAEWKKEILKTDLNLPNYRLETIYRTNLQGNYNRGRWQRFQAVKLDMPYLMYDAINDSRVRPSHLEMDGIIRPIDDPFWKTHYPPNGYNSLLPNQRVSGNVLLGLKAFYSGPAVEINTSLGGRFTCTANHPVLTGDGWISAQSLRIGDNLSCYSGEITDSSVNTDINVNNPPPTIEQVFNTLRLRISTLIPRTAVNLNGDIHFINGDVEVVGADRHLMDDIKAECLKFSDKFKLTLPHHRDTTGSCLRPFMRVFPATAILGSLRRFCRPFFDFVTSMPGFSFQLCGNNNLVINKKLGNPFSADVKVSGDAFNSSTREIQTNDAFWNWLHKVGPRYAETLKPGKFTSFMAGSFDTRITDVFIGGFGVNANALGSIRDAHPGKVKFDSVINIRLFDYSGHVYDLETKSGNILAYGGECNHHYILSNCRCHCIALNDRDAAARSMGNNGLNKPISTNDMQPDKGWDYNCGTDSMEGIYQAIQTRKETALPELFNIMRESIAEQTLVNEAVTKAVQQTIIKSSITDGIAELEIYLAALKKMALTWFVLEEIKRIEEILAND